MTTTLEDEWAEEGEDWEQKLEQIAREKQKKIEIGLLPSEGAPLAKVAKAHATLGRGLYVAASKVIPTDKVEDLLEEAGFDVDLLDLQSLELEHAYN